NGHGCRAAASAGRSTKRFTTLPGDATVVRSAGLRLASLPFGAVGGASTWPAGPTSRAILNIATLLSGARAAAAPAHVVLHLAQAEGHRLQHRRVDPLCQGAVPLCAQALDLEHGRPGSPGTPHA